jgi:metacaspase-1
MAKKRTRSHRSGGVRSAGKREPAKPRKRHAVSSKKPTATSLHIGLNAVNPGDYSGWSGQLAACEFDARDMAGIGTSQGMAPTILLTKDATRAKTLVAIRAAAKELKSGDLFFLSYSGHGGQVDDVSGEEEDRLDETWCLYDGELIDDELYLELSRFAKGVRVLVLSDSCHSGTVTRAVPPTTAAPGQRPKMMPPDVAKKVYADHKDFYDQLQRDVMKASKSAASLDPDAALAHVTISSRLSNLAARCRAAVILISGCQDNQTSMDGEHNGAFTEQLLKVWNAGAYRGNYARFHAEIKARMPSTQTPNLFQLGPTAGFAQERPFSV